MNPFASLELLRLALGTRVALVLVFMGFYRLLAFAFSRAVRERRCDGTTSSFQKISGDRRPIILVLQADRMEYDMRVLCAGDEIRVLELNEPWLAWVVYSFLPEGLGFDAYFVSRAGPKVKCGRERLRAFLRQFLPHFYRRIPADCVIRTDLKLQTDFDWCVVTEELGKPTVLIQRENLGGLPFNTILANQYLRDVDIGRYEGTHIITYNQYSKERYVLAGTAESEEISVLGCLRMDTLIERARNERSKRYQRRVTVFAIHAGSFQAPGAEADQMYRDVYVTLAEFARDNPDVALVVKLKKKDAQTGFEKNVCAMLFAEGIDTTFIPNLSFSAEGSAHDHIFASDVIVGLNTTAIIEAAIASRPVIVPYFDTLRLPKYWEWLKYNKYLDIFDVARDPADLGRLVTKRLKDSTIEPALMGRRWQAFEEYFHSHDGRTRDRVVAKLLEIVAAKYKASHSYYCNAPRNRVGRIPESTTPT